MQLIIYWQWNVQSWDLTTDQQLSKLRLNLNIGLDHPHKIKDYNSKIQRALWWQKCSMMRRVLGIMELTMVLPYTLLTLIQVRLSKISMISHKLKNMSFRTRNTMREKIPSEISKKKWWQRILISWRRIKHKLYLIIKKKKLMPYLWIKGAK